MKSKALQGLCILVILGFICCAGEKATRPLSFYHGARPPDVYFSVVGYTPQEIEFKVRIKYQGRHLYHLVLEGNEPLAEGWYPTIVDAESSYRVKIKAKKGVTFEPGKSYRLCIGTESTEYVARYRSSYQCLVDYEFVLPRQ